MRTGIYVYLPTTLTIQAQEPVVLTSLDNRSISFGSGTVSMEVSPGIYQAVTNLEIAVTGEDIHVVVVENNEDPWPDPPLGCSSAFNVTRKHLQRFFAVRDTKSAAS
jgi:hypothetical protein